MKTLYTLPIVLSLKKTKQIKHFDKRKFHKMCNVLLCLFRKLQIFAITFSTKVCTDFFLVCMSCYSMQIVKIKSKYSHKRRKKSCKEIYVLYCFFYVSIFFHFHSIEIYYKFKKKLWFQIDTMIINFVCQIFFFFCLVGCLVDWLVVYFGCRKRSNAFLFFLSCECCSCNCNCNCCLYVYV